MSIQERIQNIVTGYVTQFFEILPQIIVGIIILVIFILLARGLARFVQKKIVCRIKDKLLSNLLIKIAQWTIIVIGIAFALQVVGLGRIATSILAGAGVSAFIIGFAFKDIAENFLSGIILAYNRPFTIGDTVKSENSIGTVISIDLRNTQLKTFDGKDVFIPNATILKNPLYNHTRDGFLRYDFSIGIDYQEDIQNVSDIIIGTLKNVIGIVADKKPSVLVEEFGESTVKLKVQFWADPDNKDLSALKIKNNAAIMVKKTLSEKGIKLPNHITEVEILNQK
ncbi:mechanosensitive ion channel family protein [Patescibacteria group bacterium]|nr:mechanosensitive ion channel family protein [Patescibacteria group bacterium]